MEEKHVCINCGKDTKHKVTINYNDGFCCTSNTEYLCKKCSFPVKIGDNYFVKIKNKLYYEINAMFNLFGSLEKIYSKDQYHYLVHQKYYNMIKDIDFDIY